MNYHNYQEDIEKGKIGENIFIEYLNKNNIKYIDVRSEPEYMVKDVDFIINNKEYDVKYNYKDDEQLIIETHYNSDPQYGPIQEGWFYTSWSKYFIFISETYMIRLENSKEFKEWYKWNKSNYHTSRNKVTYNKKGNRWFQGAYVRLPIADIPEKFLKILKIN